MNPPETPAETPAETPLEAPVEAPVEGTDTSEAVQDTEESATTDLPATDVPAEPTEPTEVPPTPDSPAEQPAEPAAAAGPTEEAAEAVAPRPVAAPRPMPPRAVPRPPATAVGGAPAPLPASAPATATPVDSSASDPASSASDWGRVDEKGTVYVRTADGERTVGQMPDATPAEALAFFARRFDDLVFEVQLLERRVQGGALTPDEAAASVKKVRSTITGAQAVGDLDSLEARLDVLTTTITTQRKQRQEERARKLETARADKEKIVDEAERLAHGNDWRNGANRLRQLLDEWKALPRLEKSVDDQLWRRFSTARTTYTRRRKSHFAELNEQRDAARVVKEKLATEAESLAGSTDWGATSGRYRDLMRQWKAAGPAAKGVDDALWKRFRAAQDAFFGARDAANAEQDQEFAANAEKKVALVAEAEALLPVTDLRAAKEKFRGIADRWDAAGKVPRDRMKSLEDRMRKVERAIRGVEDDQWKRSNPEAAARAADTVAQLEASIADLEAKRDKALAAGNIKKADEHSAAIEARQSWLTEARRAYDEFSG